MTLYFCAETLGFLSSDIHGNAIPEGAIEISREAYESLLREQVTGRRIAANESGQPILLDPAAPTEASLRNLIAARRLEAEVSGVEVGGVRFSTSRDSQGLISNVVSAAMLDSGYHCNWKTLGGFIELNAEQILEMARAVRTHVQACFDREAELLTHLETGTFAESMLDEGWPA
ncbi:DUF4376 domain-containing protein [Pseudomonas sp.]|uniref:DUF4376 domain-containing protein n=1 Tax=Pseudomonas sp. TaxID=306 RepID=UPI00290E5699|nr:DUF4376 domain-containing protein [Pseudomonas sp.]MDU4251957.1 DUF4376 domain-containing protein [Pseudomonas sp.]